MDYKIEMPEFEGPFDLLLHLVKQSNIDINNISIQQITEQYLQYIELMDDMNLNVASEYLVMAAELIELKSNSLLPHAENIEDEFEENTKENLIRRLLDYEQYKNAACQLKELEEYRREIYTRDPNNLLEYAEDNKCIDYGVDLTDLLNAFSKFMEQKKLDNPLHTKITNKEYSIGKRCHEIKKLLKKKSKVRFNELFDFFSKEYTVVTFLAILSMSRNQEIYIEQENNFKDIIIKEKGENNEF